MADGDYALRHCNGCNRDKPLNAELFYTAQNKSGFRFRCKECDREAAKLRQRARLSDPSVYAATLEKNKERARRKRGPRPPIPSEIACTSCNHVFPATTEFFMPRKDGRVKLTSQCKKCHAAAVRHKRATDPEARKRHILGVSRYQKQRWQSDPAFRDKVRARARVANRRRREDPEYAEKERAMERSRYRANPERNREKNLRNRARNAAYQMAREAAKLRATPPWTEKKKIRALYAEARRLTDATGTKHNVDHIVPLRGKLVCGLHVFANLRIVTEFENKSKSNKFIEHLAV